MTNELHLTRRFARLALAIGLGLAGAGADAQDTQGAPPPSGVSYPAPQDSGSADAAAPASALSRGPAHSRGEIRPYLEVAQVLTAGDGDTLTYTSVSAGVDAHVDTRHVVATASLRYERDIDWNGHVQSQDNISGIATVHADVAPGVLALDAGGLATRTGGDGRVFGITARDNSVDVYSIYAGPTVATHAGPVAINGAYRFGYTKIDDHGAFDPTNDDFDSSTAHSLTGSVGMGTRSGLPFGWTVGGGYVREDTHSIYRQRFEGYFVRGDLVVPVSPTLAITGGVGYENLQASQRDFVRDGTGNVVPDAGGNPQPDPAAPRLLTYDMSGLMYDGGILWRPSPRTELQARAGHRYGGTTYFGTFTHQIDEHAAFNAAVYDTVETFGHQLSSQISSLPTNLNSFRDPVTGSLGGCFFGQTGGGACLDRSLQSITGDTFRARGVSATLSGDRGRWSWGLGAGYNSRRYFRPVLTGITVQGATRDQDVGVYGALGRQLSRNSTLNLGAYASWYDNNDPTSASVTTEGAQLSYNRNLLLEHLQFTAAFDVNHNDSESVSSTNASGLLGLRYTFWQPSFGR